MVVAVAWSQAADTTICPSPLSPIVPPPPPQTPGHDCVFVPGRKEWIVERSRIEQVKHEKVRQDDGLRVGQNQLSDNFDDLGATLFAAFPEATGSAMNLDLLLTARAPAVAAPAPVKAAGPSAPGQSDTGSDEDDMLAAGCRLGWDQPSVQMPAPTPAPMSMAGSHRRAIQGSHTSPGFRVSQIC